MTVQTDIAKFVATTGPDWSTSAFPRVRNAFIDTIACSIAGRNELVTRQALTYARPQSSGEADIWTTLGRASREEAALTNAVAAHALDYDDVAPAFRGHPSAVLFPAIIAMSSADTKGNDVFDAYVTGFEVAARLGKAIIATHYPAGWHSTATIGVIGATAACCRLLRLPEDHVSNAVGLAVSRAAGMQANFGTGAKPFHAGFAALSALQSVRLAALGVTASADALHSSKGFSGLYGGGADLASAFGSLGDEPPAILRSGIETKYLPICYAAHRAVSAISDLKRENDLIADDVERITVTGSAHSHDPLLKHLPNTSEEAKFSIEYAVATTLVDGSVGLGSFSQAAIARPAVQSLMSRIKVSESTKPSIKRWSEVCIVTRDGELRKRSEVLAADSDRQLDVKVDDCLAFVGLKNNAQSLRADVERLSATTVSAFFSGTMARVRAEKPLRAIA